VKNLNSIFELLDYEKNCIMKSYFDLQDQHENSNVRPSHEWHFKKLNKSMITNDDPFIHNNAVWKLGVTYKRQLDAVLRVNLNLVINPFLDKKSRIYFKKNEFFLPSNSSILNA
jgi:hypothetical protein